MDTQKRRFVYAAAFRARGWFRRAARPAFTLLMALALASGMTAMMPAHPVSAAAFTVNDTGDTVDANPGNGVCADAAGKCTLRAAIMEANALVGDDTITLPAGTYTLSRTGPHENAGAAGDLNILSNLTITGAGGNKDGDAAQTVIRAGTNTSNGIDRVISVNSNWNTPLTVTLQAVTIQYGLNNSTDDGSGGGIDFEASGTGNLTLYNCVVRDNTAAYTGGGVFASNASGGTGKLTITKSIIRNNLSKDIGGGVGMGKILFDISDSQITTNTAMWGGGVAVYNNVYADAMSTITRTTISGNTLKDPSSDPYSGNWLYGGGIYLSGDLKLVNSTISGNTNTEAGGGIYATLVYSDTTPAYGHLELVNTTVSGNVTEGYGGGLYIALDSSSTAPATLPTVTLTNATITGNTTQTGGAGVYRDSAANGTVTAYNTLIAGNRYGNVPNDVDKDAGLQAGVFDAASVSNLIGADTNAGASGLTNGTNGNILGTANTPLDARIGPLANNGGPVQTHALLADSPAIEAGNNSYVTTPTFPTSPFTDARGDGFPRLLDSADADAVQTVDIGAYEAHPTIQNITDQTVAAGATLNVTFNVGDGTLGFTSATATSGNTSVVPNNAANLSISGSGSTRTLAIKPTAVGTSTITVQLSSTINGATMTASDSFLLTATPPADMTIVKSHDGNFTQGQTGAVYRLTVSNSGGATTSGTVSATDTMPTGLTATAIAGQGWSCTLSTLTCTRSDGLAAGSSYPVITVTVSVAATADPLLTNKAAVSGGGETDTSNNSASDETTIIQLPDLVVSKAHSGNFYQGQTGATYTLSVKNQGTGLSSSETVTVKDTLPAGLTATAMSGTGWTCTLATLTCTRSEVIAAGKSYPDITLTVTVAKDSALSLTNKASVSGGGDTVTTNNNATDTATVLEMQDLILAKSHSGSFIQGQTGAAYTLTVTNRGQLATSGAVSVTDALPAQLKATALSGNGWTCTLATLTCTRSDALAAGQSYPVVTVTADVAVDAPTSVTNTASVSGGGEFKTTNDSASDPTTIIQRPDMTVTKGHTGLFIQGDTGTFTLAVKNQGAGPTDGTVTVKDLLPAELTAVTMQGAGWTCDAAKATCTRSDVLAAGASYPPVTLTVKVADTAPVQVTNNAEVSGGNELNTTNNTASDTIDVIQLPDIVVSKSHTGSFAQGQISAQYALRVKNQGTGLSDGEVSVKDTLPEGMTATALSGDGWTCDLPSLTCTRSDALAAGASYPDITLTVDVARTAPSILVNQAEVSGGGDTVPNNNTASDPTAIEQKADMIVAKRHTGAFTQGQKGVTYTLTVTNDGTGGVKGTVTVKDNLPAGLTATALSGDGWTCDLKSLTCTRADALAPGGSYPDVTLTADVAVDAPEQVTNTAEVSGGGELSIANNTASDAASIIQLADLTIASQHEGSFYPGQEGVTFKIVVKNSGKGNTDGSEIKVVDQLPEGLTATAMSGDGWTCDVKSVTCTRAEIIQPGETFAELTLTVRVGAIKPGQIVNQVTVSGGGEVNTANSLASDPTEIAWPYHTYLSMTGK